MELPPAKEKKSLPRGLLSPAARPLRLLLFHAALFALLFLLYYFIARAGYTCPFRAATGIPCPSCGITRSIDSLLHLRLGESLYYHPLTLPIAAALLLLLHRRFAPFRSLPARLFIGLTLAAVPVVYAVRLFLHAIP